MNTHQRLRLEVLGAILLCGLLVCCGRAPEIVRVPVSGTILLDGRPVPNASVHFIPRGGINPEATALVVNGEFQLDEHRGPEAGDYDVCVVPAMPEFEEVEAAIRSGAASPLRRIAIPAKYQEPGELSATIGPSPGPLEFQLVSR